MIDESAREDAALAARALGGEEEGYRQLLARHRRAVHRLVRAQTADEDAAFDITQESFIAAFASLHRYDPARPFRFWMLRIALNKCRDWRRRRAVRHFFTRALSIEDAAPVRDAAPLPDEQAEQKQRLAHARAAIDALPEGLRAVLLLRGVEGLGQKETAQLLGISEKAVETRLHRARAKLRESLREKPPGRV